MLVTDENMEEVAEWCGGTVCSTRLVVPGDCRYIELMTDRGGRKKPVHAFVGQWIARSGEKFTVYRNSVFRGTFDLKERNEHDRIVKNLADMYMSAMRFATDSSFRLNEDGTEISYQEYCEIMARQTWNYFY